MCKEKKKLQESKTNERVIMRVYQVISEKRAAIAKLVITGIEW